MSNPQTTPQTTSQATSKSAPQKTRPGWYVIQVTTGSEERMCGIIKRACADLDNRPEAAHTAKRVGLKECFSPRFISRRKRMGEWHDVERALLPGYVIADVRNPAMLGQALRGIREFSRVLAADEVYSPLNDAERTWLELQTSQENRIIPLSFGYREGDTITVTQGPLRGNEAMITKVDRKNCIAHVELHAGTMTIRTTVGLVLMPPGKQAS